jgi:hypothetical protein
MSVTRCGLDACQLQRGLRCNRVRQKLQRQLVFKGKLFVVELGRASILTGSQGCRKHNHP